MRRFAWLAAALVMCVAMLVYLQSRLPQTASGPVMPESGLAKPSEDREDLVTGLFQGALLQAQDGEDFAETPSYRRVLYHVRAMTPAAFAARVSGWLDWPDAVAHPDRWRGEFVRVRGVAASLEAVKLHGLDAGIEDVYRGFIAETDGSEAVVFDLVDPPPSVQVNASVKDVLDVEGVFYRTVRYESRTGQVREIPYLVARTLSIYKPPSTLKSPLVVGLQVLGVVLASIVVGLAVARWGSRRSRRGAPSAAAQAGFREMFEARLREGGKRTNDGPKPS